MQLPPVIRADPFLMRNITWKSGTTRKEQMKSLKKFLKEGTTVWPKRKKSFYLKHLPNIDPGMNKGRSFLIKALIFLNVCAAAGLILSYSAGYISPDKVWLLAFFGLSYPIFLIINGLFVFLWLILWKRILFLSLICILVGWNSLLAIYPARLTNPKPSASPSVKLVSYNVHSLYGNVREARSLRQKAK